MFSNCPIVQMNFAPQERNLYKPGSRATLSQHAQFWTWSAP
jgi:hypothetical protein